MKVSFYNCPDSQTITQNLPTPEFLDYRMDPLRYLELVNEYKQYKNLIIIGHGGSITTFAGIYGALSAQSTKNVKFLASIDPDYINGILTQYSPQDSLVIGISKSGETTTQLEALMQFTSYPLLFITGKDSVLEKIGHQLGAKIVEHPVIGGRYTGLTEVALIPAMLCGFDVQAIIDSALEVYEKYNRKNEAWDCASVMFQLEQDGYTDVYVPVYSHALYSFAPLISQLCHESFGKEGKGQSYLVYESPEAQHHTNQRFFGGTKNIAGFLHSQQNFKNHLVTPIPDNLSDIAMKGNSLEVLEGIDLAKAIEYEFLGVIGDADEKRIPLIHAEYENSKLSDIGQIIAFWQLYAVYSSVLRNVDPFDQPEVENSKKLSFQLRLEHNDYI